MLSYSSLTPVLRLVLHRLRPLPIVGCLEMERKGDDEWVWVVQKGQLPQDPKYSIVSMSRQQFEQCPKHSGNTESNQSSYASSMTDDRLANSILSPFRSILTLTDA